ncbi:hypothetical protein CcCBS67573_g08372 [Chytriomyces confervae]|uniref:GOLD domain-containing protein n=1 Tax=Chytriomyces confervae TaxID=246404 RepID=A0A507EK01_9FUNG|nr:hypothetical protein CcCBS67573_g08372 [Chytriomyces confervae]
MQSVVLGLLALVQFALASNNYHITMEPQSKHCFYEPMTIGQKLGLSFQVFGSSNLDIDFWVTNPDELIVQSAFRTSTGSFVVDAAKDGMHSYCISNMGHAGNVEKSVSFSVNGPDEQYKSAEKKAAGQKGQEDVKGSLETEVRELANTIQQVNDEQQYIRTRLLRHHATAESTNSRVVYWTIFEGMMIAGVIGYQIYYITQLSALLRVGPSNPSDVVACLKQSNDHTSKAMQAALALCVLGLSLCRSVAAFDWTLKGPGNTFTAFECRMTVPPVPVRPAAGKDATYFYWPGLQTNQYAPNYNPIGFGVLQPVLTYGKACTPNQPAGASVYRGWFISAQYVNPKGTETGYKGCQGGNMMDVAAGDTLMMSMVLQGTTWVQTVTRVGVACSGPGSGVSSPDGCQVSYALDMRGQGQNRAEIVLELYFNAVVTDNVLFSDIRLVAAKQEPAGSVAFCNELSRLQKNEACTGMALSQDGLTCTISSCLFTATASRADVPTLDPATIDNGNNGGVDAQGNPISVGSTIPPPADNNNGGLGAGSIAPPADISSGTGSNSGATTPSTGGSTAGSTTTGGSTQTSSKGISNTMLYGAIGGGVALVLIVGIVMYSRRSKSIDEDDVAKSGKYVQSNEKPDFSDTKEKYSDRPVSAINSLLPPRPPSAARSIGKSDSPPSSQNGRDLLRPDVSGRNHLDLSSNGKSRSASRQEMVHEPQQQQQLHVPVAASGNARAVDLSKHDSLMEFYLAPPAAEAPRAPSRQELLAVGSGNGRSASRQRDFDQVGMTSTAHVSSGNGRSSPQREMMSGNSRARSASRQDVMDKEVPTSYNSRRASRVEAIGGYLAQPISNSSRRTSRADLVEPAQSSSNRRTSRIDIGNGLVVESNDVNASSSNSHRHSRQMDSSRRSSVVGGGSALYSRTDRQMTPTPAEEPTLVVIPGRDASPSHRVNYNRRLSSAVASSPVRVPHALSTSQADDYEAPTSASGSGNGRQPRNDQLRRQSGSGFATVAVEERQSRSRENLNSNNSRRSDGRKPHSGNAREASASRIAAARQRDTSVSSVTSRRGRTAETTSAGSRSVRERSESAQRPVQDDLC